MCVYLTYSRGSGQRNTSAPCYECETSSFPVSIKPFWRRPGRKSRRRHCCNAPDCTGHSEVPIHEVDPNRVYDDGTTNKGPERPNVEDLPQQFKELDVNGPGQNYQLNHNKTKTTKKPKSYGSLNCSRYSLTLLYILDPQKLVNKLFNLKYPGTS